MKVALRYVVLHLSLTVCGAAYAEPCAEAVSDSGRLGECPETIDGGILFATRFRNTNGDDSCVDALAHAAEGDRRGGDFVTGIRTYYEDEASGHCDYRADYLERLCGVAIRCWSGGSTGLAVYPIASIGAFAIRLTGKADGELFSGLDDLTVAVGAGVRLWTWRSLADIHASLFYSRSNELVATDASGAAEGAEKQETFTRTGGGLGIGFVNGLFSFDFYYLGLLKGAEAEEGGFAFAGRIDLASGAILGLANVPK